MSIRSPDTLGNRNTLQLPEFSLKSLYQINNQSIWFLIWILKKERFWKDLTKEVLEEPFVMKREYWLGCQIKFVYTTKNNNIHGIFRSWYESGQLWHEGHWKDGKKDGIFRRWYENGQLSWEDHWKDGKRDGNRRRWYESGHLHWEQHWKDGKKDGIERCWYKSRQLYWEQHWKDGKEDGIFQKIAR